MGMTWTETAGVVAGLTVLVATFAYAVAGNRPRVDRFVAANDLPPDDRTAEVVARVLRRINRGRVLGAVTGGLLAAAVVVGFGPWAPWVVLITGVLVGTFAGIAVAQVRSRPAADHRRTASLDVRDVATYRPRFAVATVVVLVVVLVAYGTVVARVQEPGRSEVVPFLALGVVALGLAVSVAGAVLQRRVVERARGLSGADEVRVDDALRADAVRALHHVVIGLLCCALAVTGYLGASAPRFNVDVVMGIGWYLTILGFLGAVFQWGRASKAWRRPSRVAAVRASAPAAGTPAGTRA